MSKVSTGKPRTYGVMTFSQMVHIRWPLAAISSGLHRISGAFLFLLLPFILYALDQSLTSESTFEYFRGFVSGWFVKLVILALAWAYLHHFCAGFRHLVMDTHIGLEKDSARKSAAAVMIVSLALTAIVALKLFGVF